MNDLIKERTDIANKLYADKFIGIDFGGSHALYHTLAARSMGLSGKDLKRERKYLLNTDKDIIKTIITLLKDKYQDKVTIMQDQKYQLVFSVYDGDKNNFIMVGDLDSCDILTVDGVPDAVEDLFDYFNMTFEFKDNVLGIRNYYYSNSNNQVQPNFIYLTTKDTILTPKDSFYPWLKDSGYSVEKFVEEYLNSPETVLVILGPPGTGKTTFIREILLRYYQKTEKPIGTTNDQDAMTKALGDLLSNMEENDIWVFEDSDTIISSTRREGNSAISTLLNKADGISTSINNRRKIIFSSNLTDVKQIDSALMRPGRCFAVMYFRNLTRDEALEVGHDLGIELNLPLDLKEISLAEITNNRENRINASPVKRIGF